jgi:hypothetical protein
MLTDNSLAIFRFTVAKGGDIAAWYGPAYLDTITSLPGVLEGSFYISESEGASRCIAIYALRDLGVAKSEAFQAKIDSHQADARINGRVAAFELVSTASK